MSGDGAALRTYRALTVLYPRSFRAEFRDDLVQLFRDQCRDEPAARVCVRSLVDLAITIPTQHLETRMNRSSNALVPILFLALGVAGLVFAAMAGSAPGPLLFGLAVAAVGGVLAAVSWRSTSPVRVPSGPGSVAHSWWKFLLAGPSLLALVIIAAYAGVDAWYVGMVLGLTAIVLTVTGLILGIVELAGHRARPSAI